MDTKVLKLISSGTYGRVFYYRKAGKDYALKEQRYDMHFLRELTVLRKINHENILKLIDCILDPEDGKAFLVLPLANQSLRQLLRRGVKINVEAFGFQIGSGLQALHRENILHLDLKPDNILIFGNQIRICDFGSCSLNLRQIKSRGELTTIWYRAPESKVDNYITEKVDIWAYGIILYEMKTGLPLSTDEDEVSHDLTIRSRLRNPNLIRLKLWNPILSELILEILQIDPSKRPTLETILSSPFFDMNVTNNSPVVKESKKIVYPLEFMTLREKFNDIIFDRACHLYSEVKHQLDNYSDLDLFLSTLKLSIYNYGIFSVRGYLKRLETIEFDLPTITEIAAKIIYLGVDLAPSTPTDWIYNSTKNGQIRKYAIAYYWQSIIKGSTLDKEDCLELAKDSFWIELRSRLRINQGSQNLIEKYL